MVNLSILISSSEVSGPGGLFDFNATLPLVAIQFVLLMLILNTILYSPLLTVIEERKEYILGNLAKASEILAKANEVGKDKPILVFCYSGQTAGRAVMALRLSGFHDAQVMKFGFSYWSSDEDFDKWSGKTLNGAGDQAVGSPNWVTDASPSLPSNDYPNWESTTTDGAELLAERVNAMIGNSSWGISAADPLADPLGYDIYNYWNEATYTTYGSYKNAFQYDPISIANDVLQGLPTSDQCLIYCYTGQTSSMATAWLQVLGYNAKSIGYGVNSLRHDALDEAGKPTWHHSLDYTYYQD